MAKICLNLLFRCIYWALIVLLIGVRGIYFLVLNIFLMIFVSQARIPKGSAYIDYILMDSICCLDDYSGLPVSAKCLFPIVNCTIVIKFDFNNRSVILDILTVMTLSWPIPLIEFKTFDFINLILSGLAGLVERSCTVTDVMFVIKADHWWWLPWCHQAGLVLLVITN